MLLKIDKDKLKEQDLVTDTLIKKINELIDKVNEIRLILQKEGKDV